MTTGRNSIHPPDRVQSPKESQAAPLFSSPSRALKERARENISPIAARSLWSKKKRSQAESFVPVFRSIRHSRFLAPLFPFHHPGFAFFNYCETYTPPTTPRPPDPFDQPSRLPSSPTPAPKLHWLSFIVLLLYYICINHTGLGLLLSRHDTMLLLPLLLLLLLLLLPLKTPIVRQPP